jgi:Uma2 family endonuclease
MSGQPQTKLTDEEYLAIEETAEFKSEFYKGEMFAMAGGSDLHALLGNAIGSELRVALRGKDLRAYNSELKIRVARGGLYAYPDVSVVCGQVQYAEGTNKVITNPTVVVEVLSPSTEAYDRGAKSSEYRKIPSLKEYAFISQTEPRVEIYGRKSSGEWGEFSEYVGLDATCRFHSLDCSVSLADLYADVDFTSATQ